MKKEIKEAKSLRWLANMFPFTENPQDEEDKMCNAIHVYAEAGADKINELQEKINKLQNRVLSEDEADTFNAYLEVNKKIAFGNTDWNHIYRKIVGNNSSEFAEKCMEDGFEI